MIEFADLFRYNELFNDTLIETPGEYTIYLPVGSYLCLLAGGGGAGGQSGGGAGGAGGTSVLTKTKFNVKTRTKATLYVGAGGQIGSAGNGGANGTNGGRAGKGTDGGNTGVRGGGGGYPTYIKLDDSRYWVSQGGGGGGAGGNNGLYGRYQGGGGAGGGGGYYHFDGNSIINVPGQIGVGGWGGYYGGNAGPGKAGSTIYGTYLKSGNGGNGNGYAGGAGQSGSGASGGPGGGGSGNHSSAMGGGGGGGAPGVGGHGGAGGSGNNGGSSGSNHATTSKISYDYRGKQTTLGRGGATGVNGGNGWLYIFKYEAVTFSADNGGVTESVTETIDCGNLGTTGTVEVETQLYAWIGGLLNTLSPTPNVGDRAYNIDGTITDRTAQSCDGTNIVFAQDDSGGTISGTRSADADSVVLVEKEGLIPATIDYYEDNRFISESNRPSGKQLYPVEGTNEDQGLLTDTEMTNVDNGTISDYWYKGYNDDNGEIDG